MAAIEVGRICVKLAGREAGRKCIIVEVMDKNFVLITGPKAVNGVRRRRVNVNHIEPINEEIKVKRGASDEEIVKKLKDSDKIEQMKQIVKSNISTI
ncbi:MAG: 50S ribosomal protein L14e [Candidatus Bathyarchaeota archaeon]|jgi:large subunit ribosomal protein L14e